MEVSIVKFGDFICGFVFILVIYFNDFFIDFIDGFFICCFNCWYDVIFDCCRFVINRCINVKYGFFVIVVKL